MKSKRGNLGVFVGCGKVFSAADCGFWSEGIEVGRFYGFFGGGLGIRGGRGVTRSGDGYFGG
jgi:hypothetical protein